MKPGRFPVAFFTENENRRDNPQEDSESGWVSKTLSSPVQKGKRNDTLASLAGYFALTTTSVRVATQILEAWNTKYCNPPIPNSELEETVRSVYKTAKKRMKDGPLTKDGNLKAVNDDFSLMGFSDYMATFHGQEQRWLVQDWLPDSSVTFVVSAPGGHKTWMLLDLAVSVASGMPFLGKFPVMEKGPVILIQQEDFHGQTVERLSLIAHARLGLKSDEDSIDLPPSLPILIHPDRKLKFSDEKVIAQLEKAVHKIKPKLVILDPLYSAAETDDFMASTAEQMFCLKKLRDQVGTGFVIAHHTNKSGEGGRMAAWGSQFLNAFLETGWQLRPGKKETVKVSRHFKQFANAKDVNLKFEIDSEDAYSYQVKEVAFKDDDKTAEPTEKKDKKKKSTTFSEEQVAEKPVEEEEVPNIVHPKKSKDKIGMIHDCFLLNKKTLLSVKDICKVTQCQTDTVNKNLQILLDKGHIVKVDGKYRNNI